MGRVANAIPRMAPDVESQVSTEHDLNKKASASGCLTHHTEPERAQDVKMIRQNTMFLGLGAWHLNWFSERGTGELRVGWILVMILPLTLF